MSIINKIASICKSNFKALSPCGEGWGAVWGWHGGGAFILFLLLFSCGEDRSYELEEKTQHNRWILEVMRDEYLWNASLLEAEPEWKNFFLAPGDFVKKIADKTDKWSYVEVDTIVADKFPCGHFNHINSYGFDYTLMNDPTGQTTKTFARVLTVYPNSPAAQCGLRRNDFISAFDGFKITQKNLDKLEKGGAITLTVQNLSTEGEEYILSDERSLQMGESRYVEDVAFPVCNTLQVAGINIGYLMCTRLIPSSEQNTDYLNALDAAMKKLKADDVSEIVLDFRLCNRGTIEMAQRLASYVVNPTYLGTTFVQTAHNDSHAASNAVYQYDKSVDNLSLGRVYIITSGRTQGAAEWLIHGLKSTMGEESVIVVGAATAGQNVMTRNAGSDYRLTLFPAVAYVADCDGNCDYGKITPDEPVEESQFAFLGEYGQISEPLLANILQLIVY